VARTIKFYKTISGKCPVEEFLDSLVPKVAQKVTWVLSVIEELDFVPKKYFKKLVGQHLWECRVDFGGNTYRLLGFFHEGDLIILTNGFMKKTNKMPDEEIKLANKYRDDFIKRGGIV
jgi:phage-related protein